MSAKVYWLKFGSGDPRLKTGLTPTFLLFFDQTGAVQSKPSITEVVAGSGAYGFSFASSATQSIFFLASAATTFATVADGFISGVLDPVLAVDQNTSSIGALTDSFGTTSQDPTSLVGYVKRLQELLEGDQSFAAATGIWAMYSRGSSTLLRDKTVVNSGSSVTKTGL